MRVRVLFSKTPKTKRCVGLEYGDLAGPSRNNKQGLFSSFSFVETAGFA